jgi:hypothetical protein
MLSLRRYFAPVVLIPIGLSPLFALACDDGPATAPTASRQSRDNTEAAGASPALLALAGEIPLPYTDTVTSGVPAFEIKQKGGGHAGRFEITNGGSSGIAVDAVTVGTGHALLAWNQGLGRAAMLTQTNSANPLPAVDVSTSGLGSAMEVSINNSSSTATSLLVDSRGTGPVLTVNHLGTAGALAQFQVGGISRIRFSRAGKGFFNGGTQIGGADVAEAFAVEGALRDYAPGDVLVISDRSDRRVEQSSEAYSMRVIGVYATKPGVLLTERGVDEPMTDLIPVGVIGVIPTKVSGENGAIRRGDLLVSAGTRGHAMLGTARDRMLGATIGKALAEFSGPGTGVIPVLVNVK